MGTAPDLVTRAGGPLACKKLVLAASAGAMPGPSPPTMPRVAANTNLQPKWAPIPPQAVLGNSPGHDPGGGCAGKPRREAIGR